LARSSSGLKTGPEDDRVNAIKTSTKVLFRIKSQSRQSKTVSQTSHYGSEPLRLTNLLMVDNQNNCGKQTTAFKAAVAIESASNLTLRNMQ
jgi:hypothetical protein